MIERTSVLKRILMAAIFLSVIILSLAIIGEVFCRLVMPLNKNRDRYVAVRNIFQFDERNVLFDEELGYSIKPNLKVPFNNEEFRTVVTTNSMGFRDNEDSLRNPSIFILGDSLGFGWGVNWPASCDKALEDLYGARVLNMSVPGYGPLQELLALKRFGEKYDIKGKTVIFLLCFNDVADTMGFGSGSIKIENNSLNYSIFSKDAFNELMELYKTRSYRGIYRTSYMLYILKNAQKELKNKLRNKKKTETTRANTVDPHLKYEIFGLVIDKIKDFCSENKIKAIFLWIPSIRSFEDNAAKFGDDYEDTVLSEVTRIFNRSGLQLISLKGRLTHNDYYRLDGHLKPSGQYKIAAEINKLLSEE